eukprot:TRINITY_DN114_c0_g1_i1.p1 TRINITY_DN114_c0_g1~~TRINITY_DN114_c0_g1_i1.p1  ORF type:complete len:587 (-),score=63.73 TRINITY_DN114_c0_g1_i1:84-1844(-)
MMLRCAMALFLGHVFAQSCGSEGSCDEVPEPQHTVLLQYSSFLEAQTDEVSALVTSVDHSSGVVGTYFNFDKPSGWTAVGDNPKIDVKQCRGGVSIWSGSVTWWNSKNGGSTGNSHGRRTSEPAAGQWQVGDTVTSGSQCPKACSSFAAADICPTDRCVWSGSACEMTTATTQVRSVFVLVNGLGTSILTSPYLSCGSGEHVATQSGPHGTDSDCEAYDQCRVDVNAACEVRVWFRNRCASRRHEYGWSAYTSSAVGSGACQLQVSQACSSFAPATYCPTDRCVWSGSACETTTTTLMTTTTTTQVVDCMQLPISMNGGSYPRGCPGAVWNDGSPSESYCGGRNGQFPWWGACCYWSEGACLPQVPTNASSTTPTTTCGGNSCQIWGDPHVSGFDNSEHRFPGYLALLGFGSCEVAMRPIDVNMYDVGDFWLVRSAELRIQSRFARSKDFVPDRPAIAALAISGPLLDNKRLNVQPLDMSTTWNGQQVRETHLDVNMTSGSLNIRSHKGPKGTDVLEMRLPKGVHLRAVRFLRHIDATVTLPKSFVGAVDGLCGNRNGLAEDDAKDIVAKRMHGIVVLPHERLIPA